MTDSLGRWFNMSEDQEFMADNSGEETAISRSLGSAARLTDAVALIDACRKVDSIKSEDRATLRESGILDALGIQSDGTDANRAIEDASVVAAAFHVACDLVNNGADQKPLTSSAVRKVLETLIVEAEMIEAAERRIAEVLIGGAGPHALMLVEETALDKALRPLLTVSPKIAAVSRFAKQTDRVKMLVNPISRAMLMRRAVNLVGRVRSNSSQPDSLAKCVVAARNHSLPDDVGTRMEKIAESIPGELWNKGTRAYLLETARNTLVRLRNGSAPSAFVGPSANLVLATGALELFCAWKPDQRPMTTDGGTVALVIEHLRVVCRTGDKLGKKRGGALPETEGGGETPRQVLLDVVDAWKLGRAATLFDGCDTTRERRQRCLRNFRLDADHHDDPWKGPEVREVVDRRKSGPRD